MYEYNAVITNIVDGDTFDLDVDLGFKIHHYIRARLLDIDTPESRGKEEKELGKICTDFAKKHFIGKKVMIKSMGQDIKTDSFGRWLVYINLNEPVMGFNNVVLLYNLLGINKKDCGYSEDKVKALANFL